MDRRQLFRLGGALGATGLGASRLLRPAEAAPVPLYRWVDTDFGLNPIPPLQWFVDRKNEGYRGFLTTAHTYWNAVPQPWSGTQECLDKALTAGLSIGAYGRPVECWQAALDNCGPYKQYLKFYQLDVEHEPDGPHPLTQAMVTGVQQANVRVAIYTYASAWQEIMGGSQAFRWYPLWERVPYTGWPQAIGDILPNPPGFGGWTKRAGAQIHYDLASPPGGPILIDDNTSLWS